MTAAPVLIAEPGVYDGMPVDMYLADPVPGGSLSASGARLLLPPSCPAKYRWYADHGRPPKDAFDFGHAAHKVALGDGPPIEVVDAADWRTKAAREAKEKAHANGRVPLLAEDWATVQAMAGALREHPLAAALLDPASGRPEQTLIWQDDRTGVFLRSRVDWLRHVHNAGRLIIPDYKSCVSADPESAAKAMHNYGYYRQAPFYEDGAVALGLTDAPAFVLIMQEKTPPYLVAVYQPDPFAMRAGRAVNRKAIDVYRRCVATGQWPGYGDDIQALALPSYAEYQHNAALDAGTYDTEDAA
jgi:hypothetical protein